ncbi:hypothetical protein M0813_06759 [Anaeramoeba flamelloides]|uniref:Uncharacterized protein n=1 Tax=Anaeramoeba flamelloides TaxID=1746091 RepID=A0ABQ8XD09_9EUKA|nr:hypothetical protein M0813_06759 [Anaeramoeba flamelloides]
MFGDEKSLEQNQEKNSAIEIPNNSSDNFETIQTPISPWNLESFDLDSELSRNEKPQNEKHLEIKNLKKNIKTLEEETKELKEYINEILIENRKLKKKINKKKKKKKK